ncbi:hypothetical protein B0I27_11221 [Arcticibacter pallidicorallinus]|uniref:Uncharacterized protein n=1 Tax=Arcticibacter pallidicorallinus TaxID=1259464 RepID=A0A2T0TU04_9SPHI|nr:hypothetical protein B0I27_11221 [Arcticibacter pallidicorallinus]
MIVFRLDSELLWNFSEFLSELLQTLFRSPSEQLQIFFRPLSQLLPGSLLVSRILAFPKSRLIDAAAPSLGRITFDIYRSWYDVGTELTRT